MRPFRKGRGKKRKFQGEIKMQLFWLNETESRPGTDEYAAFRFTFEVPGEEPVRIRIFGAHRFIAWQDGVFLTEGPFRFDGAHPQYEELVRALPPGRHVIAAKVHDERTETRILPKTEPCFGLEILAGGEALPLLPKACRLDYDPALRRINAELAWAEFCDLNRVPDFEAPDFDDSGWGTPRAVAPVGPLTCADLAHFERIELSAREIGRGRYCEAFGYADDDPPTRFFLRDLEPKDMPADGIWLRFDLGKVSLFRVEAEIEAPEGSVAEIAFSETLASSRVRPWIPLSASLSCNLDRFVLRPGCSRFFNLTPHGGRFAEVHVSGDPAAIRVRRIAFLERCSLGAPAGAFHCGEELLDRIWLTGAETLRSCAEDAIVDNPTRERGEWTGDCAGVGIGVCGAAFDDYRVVRRGLRHAAYCASEDGCVAGLCPGTVAYNSTYALQWAAACLQYYRMTGDRAFLEEMYGYAEKNFGYFRAHWTPAGLDRGVYWNFIDWGYVSNEGESDMALNLHLHIALGAFSEWCRLLGRAREAEEAEAFRLDVKRAVAAYFASCRGDWARIGLHRAALALGEGFFSGEEREACIRAVKQHYLSCFPNDASAPRLDCPSREDTRLITPYFSHFAFKALWENGEGDFVLDQYRSCWGWLLAQDNTWLEVFDTRWSHCHQWSGCPTWQLSRYVLGIEPRFDRGQNCFDFAPMPCSLKSVRGAFPICGGGRIEVVRGGREFELRADREVRIRSRDGEYELTPGQRIVLQQ